MKVLQICSRPTVAFHHVLAAETAPAAAPDVCVFVVSHFDDLETAVPTALQPKADLKTDCVDAPNERDEAAPAECSAIEVAFVGIGL